MTGTDQAMDKARQAAEGGLVAELADRVGARAGVEAVFGAPVEQGGVTVVPVARLSWGFGGGGGAASGEAEGEGSGGGGGVMATPAGFIEIADGQAEFRPIGSPISPGYALAGALAFYLVMRGLRLLWH